MKAYEFLARIGSEGQLILPMKAQDQLPRNRTVRVLVLVDEPEVSINSTSPKRSESGSTDPFQDRLSATLPEEDHLWYESPTIPYDGI
ncbi:MAG: hypothetical protein Q6L60_07675 [Thermostichus sp. HHBFW_bins_43]